MTACMWYQVVTEECIRQNNLMLLWHVSLIIILFLMMIKLEKLWRFHKTGFIEKRS